MAIFESILNVVLVVFKFMATLTVVLSTALVLYHWKFSRRKNMSNAKHKVYTSIDAKNPIVNSVKKVYRPFRKTKKVKDEKARDEKQSTQSQARLNLTRKNKPKKSKEGKVRNYSNSVTESKFIDNILQKSNEQSENDAVNVIESVDESTNFSSMETYKSGISKCTSNSLPESIAHLDAVNLTDKINNNLDLNQATNDKKKNIKQSLGSLSDFSHCVGKNLVETVLVPSCKDNITGSKDKLSTILADSFIKSEKNKKKAALGRLRKIGNTFEASDEEPTDFVISTCLLKHNIVENFHNNTVSSVEAKIKDPKRKNRGTHLNNNLGMTKMDEILLDSSPEQKHFQIEQTEVMKDSTTFEAHSYLDSSIKYDEKVKELEVQIKKLESEKSSILTELQNQLKSKIYECSLLKCQLEEANRISDGDVSEFHKLKIEVDSLKTQLHSASLQLSHMQNNNAELECTVKSLTEELQKAVVLKQSRELTQQRLTNEVQRLNNELTQSRVRIKATATDLDRTNIKSQKQNEELKESWRSDVEKQLSQANNQVTELKKHLLERDNEIQEMERGIAKIKGELHKATILRTQLEQEILDKEQKIFRLQEFLHQAQKNQIKAASSPCPSVNGFSDTQYSNSKQTEVGLENCISKRNDIPAAAAAVKPPPLTDTNEISSIVLNNFKTKKLSTSIKSIENNA